MKNKYIFTLLAVAISSMVFVGCGAGANVTTETTTENTESNEMDTTEDEDTDETEVFEEDDLEQFSSEYGDVISETAEYDCPYCGTTIYRAYQEAFVLSNAYSDYAIEINSALKSKMADALNYTPDITDDSECEWHLEDPELSCETDENRVTDVAIINDRYLTVDMASYWFGGGAHGMSGMGQYVFDLDTGEELILANFYGGSEEDLRELVAERVKEDYISHENEEYTGYFAESADEAYSEAYDLVSIDDANVLFKEDTVTYYFNPYDLGSYADGYKMFDFTYEDMFGTDALERVK